MKQSTHMEWIWKVVGNSGDKSAASQMHVGTAIFLVAIIGFAIFSHGFRVFLLWLATAVVGIIVTCFLSANTSLNIKQKERARIEAEKGEQQRQQTT